MTSTEDEQREAGSESRASRLETHAATQERSDESVTKVVCLHFGPERVFKNLRGLQYRERSKVDEMIIS